MADQMVDEEWRIYPDKETLDEAITAIVTQDHPES